MKKNFWLLLSILLVCSCTDKEKTEESQIAPSSELAISSESGEGLTATVKNENMVFKDQAGNDALMVIPVSVNCNFVSFNVKNLSQSSVVGGSSGNLVLLKKTDKDDDDDGKAYGLEKGWKCPVGIAYTLIARPAVATGSELDFAIDFDKLGYKLEEGIYRLYTSPAKTHDVEIIGGNGETKEEREYINVYLEFEIKR